MKILHIVPSYKPAYIYGGPIESISRLCEGLAEAGHDVHVYTTTANGPGELDVTAGQPTLVDGVVVTYFNRITKDPTHVSPELWRTLGKSVKNFDIVHVHSWWNILVLVATAICLRKGAKVVVAPRGMLSNYIFSSGSSKAKKIIHKLFGKQLLGKTYLHATAPAELEECRGLIPGWKGFVAPNILTLPDLPVIRNKNKPLTLIFLSRIHPKKGLELVFEALSKISFDIVLKIAGSGDEAYINDLKKLAAELKIMDKIEWLGWMDRDTKFKELMNADLFILMSKNENFANVVIESLHMGTPVFISEGVALAQFVQKEDMGWTSPLHLDQIVARLHEIHGAYEKTARINNIGRKVIADTFSETKLINDYVDNYRNILAGN